MSPTVKGISAEEILRRMSADRRKELIAAFQEYARHIGDLTAATSGMHARLSIEEHIGQVTKGGNAVSHLVKRGASAYSRVPLPIWRYDSLNIQTADDMARALIDTYRSVEKGRQLSAAFEKAFG